MTTADEPVEPFHSELVVREGVPAIRVAGEMDTATADEFLRTVSQISGDQDVVLEAAELRFVDSSGLHALMHLHRRVSERGHAVVIRQPTRQFLRLLELTNTAELFRIEAADAS